MTDKSNTIDMGGLDIVVNTLYVGATKPGQAGTNLSSAEISVLDGVTAGAVTASKALIVDSNKDLASLRNVTMNNAILGGYLQGTADTRTGAGAISVTTLVTKIVTTAADALTLADGVDGQIKILVMKTDGGDGTLTPTTKTGFSTVTFNDVGDTVMLLFTTTTGWTIVSNTGATVA